MNTAKIGNIKIGSVHPCFIIAEVGSNHDGKLEQAMRLIDVAKDAGVDAVKFQSFLADKLHIKTEADYHAIKSAELPRQWHKTLSKYCSERGVIFLSTPFDFEAVDILEEVNVPAYKVASGDITHYPLLKYISKTRKPVILSTGKSDLSDVIDAYKYLIQCDVGDIVLLHCITSYPADISQVNLSVIPELKKRFNVPVGFSDHTLNTLVPAFAVCYGADVIEKHITLDRNLSGPDHPYAMEPKEFKELVCNIKIAEKARGTGRKEPAESEKKGLLTGRRAIFALKDIQKGTVITKELVDCLRPRAIERNISAKEYEKVIGKKAKRDIRKHSAIIKDDIEV